MKNVVIPIIRLHLIGTYTLWQTIFVIPYLGFTFCCIISQREIVGKPSLNNNNNNKDKNGCIILYIYN